MEKAEETLTREECYLFQEFLVEEVGPWNPQNGAKNWVWHTKSAVRAKIFLRIKARMKAEAKTNSKAGAELMTSAVFLFI